MADIKEKPAPPEPCTETDIINFDEAKRDPKIDKINYDLKNAKYIFDIIETMIGEDFKKDAEAAYAKYVSEDAT